IPVSANGDGIERDPNDHNNRLTKDVLRRSEEASRLLRRTAEGILTEGAVLLLGHASESTASGGQCCQLLVTLVTERLEGAAVEAGRSSLPHDPRMARCDVAHVRGEAVVREERVHSVHQAVARDLGD